MWWFPRRAFRHKAVSSREASSSDLSSDWNVTSSSGMDGQNNRNNTRSLISLHACKPSCSVFTWICSLFGLYFIFWSFQHCWIWLFVSGESFVWQFPVIIALLLDLHDFNPPPFWAVIQSVKQQLFAQSAVKATVANPFQLFFFSNPIWCPNDHPPFPYWILEGSAAPCHEPNFQVPPCCDEFPRCESETGCCWLSKLILYFKAV